MSAVAKSDAREARERAGRIRAAGGVAGALTRYFDALAEITKAYEGRHWEVLGYGSWEAYVDGEFGPDQLPLSGRFRKKVLDLCKPPVEPQADRRSVYFIQAVGGGLIKIGVAGHVLGRLADIQRMCPVRLSVLAAIPGVGQERETELHQRFAFARRHGEWFTPVPELLTYIAENGVRP